MIRPALVLLALALAAPAHAGPFSIRVLNFHRGPGPRVLHVEVWCTLDVPQPDPCPASVRGTMVFRFAAGSTPAERRAEMRPEVRRYCRRSFLDAGCSATPGEEAAAPVAADEANP